jgi:hypothetical protein
VQAIIAGTLWFGVLCLLASAWYAVLTGSEDVGIMCGITAGVTAAAAAVATLRRYAARICALVRLANGLNGEVATAELHAVR